MLRDNAMNTRSGVTLERTGYSSDRALACLSVASKQDSSLSYTDPYFLAQESIFFIFTCCILELNSKSYYELLPKRIRATY